MQSNQTLKLYTYFRSSTSWRIRIALNLKKINYEPIFVNLLKGEQKSEEYGNVNPNHAVPALDVDGTILIESMAIAEYLEERYPEIKLLPTDLFLKNQVRGFCEIINSAIHPFHNLRMFEFVEKLSPGFDRVGFIQPMLERGFSSLERIVEKTHGKFCFGNEITLADVFLVPQIGSAQTRFNFDITKYPHINQIYQNIKDIPEFVAAQPDKQPDFK